MRTNTSANLFSASSSSYFHILLVLADLPVIPGICFFLLPLGGDTLPVEACLIADSAFLCLLGEAGLVTGAEA